ncbi:MAG TPA: hypothetical protein VF691_21230 [Cytophagaceae bacterium]
MKDFFSTLKNTILCFVGILFFVTTQGSESLEHLIKFKIIAFEGELIYQPFLREHIWYIFGAMFLIILAFAYNVYAYFKGLPQLLDFVMQFVCVFVFGITVCLFGLAKPAPWYGIALVLLLLYTICWLLFKVLLFPPTNDNSSSK